jgi:hypothetical protein
MDKLKIKAMLRHRLPFKIAYTKSNFKVLMKLCAEEEIVWASNVLPQDAVWYGKKYADWLCVDYWLHGYAVATPLFKSLQSQTRLDIPRFSYRKNLHKGRR